MELNGTIVSEEHDVSNINFVAGMSDPGEMIRCGYRPELRRLDGEKDAAYADRIRPLVMALPKEERDLIMASAIARADLDVSNGRVNVMVAGPVAAWHKVGVHVSEAQKWEAASILGGVSFTVDKQNMLLENGSQVKGWYATVREDTGAQLGVVGERYKVIQNKDCFAFMDSLVGEHLAMYESVGSISGGKSIWMCVRFPKEYRIEGTDDTINPYALLSNNHAGEGAVKVMPTIDRPVCGNTYRVAVGRAKKAGSILSIRHSKGMDAKIHEARRMLGVMEKGFDRFMVQANAMARVQLNDEQVNDYFTSLFPTSKPKKGIEISDLIGNVGMLDAVIDQTMLEAGQITGAEMSDRTLERNKKIVESLKQSFASDPTNNLRGIEGSAWSAFNAVTQYVDHGKTGRGKNDQVRLENHVNNVLFGSGQTLKAEAFQGALAFAGPKA